MGVCVYVCDACLYVMRAWAYALSALLNQSFVVRGTDTDVRIDLYGVAFRTLLTLS